MWPPEILPRPVEAHVCPLCWDAFPTEDALRLHIAVEDDRLYDLTQSAGTAPTRVVGDSE